MSLGNVSWGQGCDSCPYRIDYDCGSCPTPCVSDAHGDHYPRGPWECSDCDRQPGQPCLVQEYEERERERREEMDN